MFQPCALSLQFLLSVRKPGSAGHCLLKRQCHPWKTRATGTGRKVETDGTCRIQITENGCTGTRHFSPFLYCEENMKPKPAVFSACCSYTIYVVLFPKKSRWIKERHLQGRCLSFIPRGQIIFAPCCSESLMRPMYFRCLHTAVPLPGKQEKMALMYDDCDDTFAFIAGYTDGGAPYGTTWREAGIDPELPFDEKVRQYMEMICG